MKTKLLLFIFCTACFVAIYSSCNEQQNPANNKVLVNSDTTWHTPDTLTLINDPNAEFIRYGEKLVANTSYYLGPKGIITHSSNGMNCQNCHLQAGTRPFGNNFGAVASKYPYFNPRSGAIENIYRRVNECMRRSLNGKAIDTNSREMRAITEYLKWVGKDVIKEKIPNGAGGVTLAYSDNASDTNSGRGIYVQKCQLCHGKNGAGIPNANGIGYQYPPLWGKNSYNSGAGMYRLSKLAAFIKYNMPFGTTYQNPQLSNEESWNVAAFINSQQRPGFDASIDWPNIATKPIDYPFGPYSDNFTESQHKYGPFKPIADARKQRKQ